MLQRSSPLQYARAAMNRYTKVNSLLLTTGTGTSRSNQQLGTHQEPRQRRWLHVYGLNSFGGDSRRNGSKGCGFRDFGSSSFPPHLVVNMPALSPTMEVGSIARWNVKDGDKFAVGQALCEVETDKATVTFDATEEGYVAKILVGNGEIKVGQPIMVTVEDESAIGKFGAFVASSVAPASSASSASKAVIAEVPEAKSQGRTPLIKFIGKRSKLPATVSTVSSAKSPTTPLSFPSVSTSTSASSQAFQLSTEPVNNSFTDVPNSNMRKVIAKRLTESKATVPHLYVQLDCEIDELLATRNALKSQFDSSVSVNDMVIKSAALALRDLPQVAAKWNKALGKAEGTTGSAVSDIAVAVATPNGLITPIVKGAHELGVAQVQATVKDLAGRAREGKLKPDEYQGGSFSISNLGMFGISSFSAVINPPQACILAVGAGIPRVLPPKNPGEKPRVATVVSVQLSADRRVVDEATAAQFLQIFADYLSRPQQTIL